MDQIRTGSLIRRLRLEQGMTQLALAERLGVSDKAVSKWERGCGAPDLSILPLLSQALEVDTDTLLRGDLEANDLTNGNLKRMRFYLCPECGNLLISQENADISCCGRRLSPLEPQKLTRHTCCMQSGTMENGISPQSTACTGSIIFPLWHCSAEIPSSSKSGTRNGRWKPGCPICPKAHCFGTAHSTACSASGCKTA